VVLEPTANRQGGAKGMAAATVATATCHRTANHPKPAKKLDVADRMINQGRGM
jgi:hypothetical protein